MVFSVLLLASAIMQLVMMSTQIVMFFDDYARDMRVFRPDEYGRFGQCFSSNKLTGRWELGSSHNAAYIMSSFVSLYITGEILCTARQTEENSSQTCRLLADVFPREKTSDVNMRTS